MNCFYHSYREAVGFCLSCGRPTCAECKVTLGEKFYCNLCADRIISGKPRTSIVPEQNSPRQRSSLAIPKTIHGLSWVSKAKTGTGRLVQIIGGIIFVGSGLTVFIWELYVLFTAFGAWTILIALLFAPITYFAAIFIVWFSTGSFPIIVLILWLASWIGAGVIYVGNRITGED